MTTQAIKSAPLSNQQMKSNRFGAWAKARKKLNWMNEQWDKGMTVCLDTSLKVYRTSRKHKDMFKATKTGLYMQVGKKWLCVDGCQLSAF